MNTFGQQLVESLEEALAHAKGEGPAIIHTVTPREVRLEAKLTQAQMAQLMGMSLSGYRKWEQGTRNVSGPAKTLLRMMHEEPETVRRALLPGEGRPHEGRLGDPGMERQDSMRFDLSSRALEDPAAPPEELATAGVLSISANGTCLTEGVSLEDDALRPGPLVSAYPLAEWLVWNWWRLRWEPTPPRVGKPWAFAHRLSSVGGGYRWPNLEIASDGEHVRLTSAPTVEPHAATYRYVGAPRSETVTAATFESAVNAFVEGAVGRLGESGPEDCNLRVLVNELARDKADVERTAFRRLEAMLGSDPGEGDASAIRRRLSDANSLGEHAVLELAAGAPSVGAAELQTDLDRVGFDFRPGDSVTASGSASVPQWGSTEAWRIGVALAGELRQRELPNGDPVTNGCLAEMAGAPERMLSDGDNATDSLSFEWETPRRSRMALRAKWETGRRFDLARLLAERLLRPLGGEPVRAATKSYTYGQKAQRAFAVEFLAPINAVDAFLSGDYSEERQSEAADHFQVSSYAIRSLLVNNHRLGRPGALDALDRM